MAMNFDKSAEDMYDDEDRAADRAQTARKQNNDFFLTLPDPKKPHENRAHKIVFLSHGVPMLFWKVNKDVELLSRDSKILSDFFPHYNRAGLPDPLGANKKNSAFWNIVFPVMHLTDGWFPEGKFDANGKPEFVPTPKIKFWRCSSKKATQILDMRRRLLLDVYKKAEDAVTADPTRRADWLAKGYMPFADIENLLAGKTWEEIAKMSQIPEEMKQKASLVGKVVNGQLAYNTFTVSRTGEGTATTYTLDMPTLTYYNWDALKSVPSKKNPGTMVDVLEYKRPDYRGCYGKIIPGSLAEQLFMGGESVMNTELESPNLNKPGECDALTIFTYANVAKSAYTPYEGYSSATQQAQPNLMSQAPAATPVEVPADDLF